MFDDPELVRAAGFTGFRLVSELRATKLAAVPKRMGVYMVLRTKTDPPKFRKQSPAGHFKRKDPTVSVATLRDNWVESTSVLYIGKAGAPDEEVTLRSRLAKYLAFGSGSKVSHWGGRLIWQLADSDELVVCWKPTPNEVPAAAKQDLIDEFKASHSGRRPFANLLG